MSETQLSKSIRGALEAAGVWVIQCSEDDGRPALLLPEYAAWLRTEPNDAWDAHARARGVRVALVAGEYEALLQVSIWQDATPQQNLPAWRRARAKYVTRGSLRLVK